MRVNHLIYTILCLFTINSHAELSVKELQAGISQANPVYDVPKGQLGNVVTFLKDYSMIVKVTSNSTQYNCGLCDQFEPIFLNIATLIYRKYPQLKDRLFFINVEASIHLEDLKKLGIQSIPQVWGFPDSHKIYGDNYDEVSGMVQKLKNGINVQSDKYDVDKIGMEHYIFEMVQGEEWDIVIERLGVFITQTVGVDITEAIQESKKEGRIDWIVTAQWFVYIFIAIKVFQKLKSNSNDIPFYKNKNLYIYLTLLLIYINLSGFNFTVQRQAPFISHKNGQILWIAPQPTTQFASEIAISIFLQVSFTGVLIGIIDVIKRVDDVKKDYIVILCSISLLSLLIIGINIYQYKSPHYPFNYIKII